MGGAEPHMRIEGPVFIFMYFFRRQVIEIGTAGRNVWINVVTAKPYQAWVGVQMSVDGV